MDSDILVKLKELAFKRTIPFCYCCYKEAPTGTCNICHSDDLMRLLPGIGCEYGTDWVIKEILREDLQEINLREAFEASLEGCYPETVQVGWLNLDTITNPKRKSFKFNI